MPQDDQCEQCGVEGVTTVTIYAAIAGAAPSLCRDCLLAALIRLEEEERKAAAK